MDELTVEEQNKILAEVAVLLKRKRPAPGEWFDARALQRLIQRTEHLEPLHHTTEFGTGTITGGPEGQEKICLRVVMDKEASEVGARGLNGYEAFALMLRIEQINDIEHAAINLQRNVVRLRLAMAALLGDLRSKKMPPDRDILKAVQVLKETE